MVLAEKDIWGWGFGLVLCLVFVLFWVHFMLCTEVNTQPSNISLTTCSIPKLSKSCLGFSLRQTLEAGQGQSWPLECNTVV